MAVSLEVPPCGIVIERPGSYALAGPVSFSGAGAPPECVDPVTGAAVTGILIQADGVTLDLSGFTVGLSTAAAIRVREFSCLRVTGNNARVINGTLGRATAFGVVAVVGCNKKKGLLTLKGLAVRDFEEGGIQVEGVGGVSVLDCAVGPNFQGRRPDVDLSLAARYLPALDGLPLGELLSEELAAASKTGPFRSDLGGCVGVSVSGCCLGLTIAGLYVTNLSQRPVRVPFLGDDGTLPRGALGDPIPAAGVGAARRAAQEAATQAGRLPPPDKVPACPPPTQHPCLTYATNLGICSSCTPSRPPLVSKSSFYLGFDGRGASVFGAVGVRLENLAGNYVLSDITVSGLQARLGSGATCPCAAAAAHVVGASRCHVATAELLLVGCVGGEVSGGRVPAPLLVHSERPAGAPCKLPPGFSAAWVASGSSQTRARPVGNAHNVQIKAAVLPPTAFCP